MTQQSLTEGQLAELAEIAEIAKAAEQKAKEMSELATAIAQKYQKRLHEIKQTSTEKQEE